MAKSDNPPIKKNDKNFRRDVGIAKAKYRKKRFSWFVLVCSILFLVFTVRIALFSKEKRDLENKITEQKEKITQLEKENKANKVVISKFKDPYFITDLVRQEYSMSYPGEIIFNLPIKESFMEQAIKSITTEDIDKQISEIEKGNQIDEKKLEKKLKEKGKLKQQKEEEHAKEEKKLKGE